MLTMIKYHKAYLASVALFALGSSGLVYYPAVVLNRWIVDTITSEHDSFILSAVLGIVLFTAIMKAWDLIAVNLSFALALFKRRQKKNVCDTLYAELMVFVSKIKGDCLEDSSTYEKYIRCKKDCIARIAECPSRIAKILASFVTAVMYIDYMRDIDIRPMLVITAAIVVKYIVSLKINRKKYRYDEVLNNYFMKIDAYTDIVSDKDYVCEMKVYGNLDYVIGKRRELCRELSLVVRRMSFLDIRNSLVAFVSDKSAYFAAYIFYALKALFGEVSIGYFTASVASVNYLESAVSAVFNSFTGLAADAEYYNAYYEFLDSTPTAHVGQTLDSIFSISSENLGYTYPGADIPALIDIGLTLKCGMKVCIVGENGSGKTTLAKILAGVYEMYTGRIRYNNENAEDVSTESIFSAVDMCQQAYTKYPFSLEYNVSFGDTDEIILAEALKKSRVDEFAYSLPNGIYTGLDAKYDPAGIDLSEGQWQRLLLARVFYAEKNIVIFDEPTASIDPITENKIFSELLKLKDKLVIVISHRMSCAAYMDKVIMLDDGKIAETGSHAELMSCRGKYYDLFSAQADRYEM